MNRDCILFLLLSTFVTGIIGIRWHTIYMMTKQKIQLKEKYKHLQTDDDR